MTKQNLAVSVEKAISSSVRRFPITPNQRSFMPFNNSPLESLAAFALVFAAGALSILGFGAYIEKVKKDTRRASQTD
jgi:hypothetical protein